MMTELEKYYNKFNEEKRLKSRHGQVEFITSMKYIHKYLPKREHGQVKILDVGAGTGRYSVALAEEGYDVTKDWIPQEAAMTDAPRSNRLPVDVLVLQADTLSVQKRSRSRWRREQNLEKVDICRGERFTLG